jgi:hypothetical protein
MVEQATQNGSFLTGSKPEKFRNSVFTGLIAIASPANHQFLQHNNTISQNNRQSYLKQKLGWRQPKHLALPYWGTALRQQ